MKQIKKLGDQMSEEFNQAKQLIKDFNIEDQDKLKQEITIIMNRDSINVRLNKIEIQLNKIEKIIEQLENKFGININEKLQKD